jgi:predicted ATP-grasp superfamily ATP-dependent carboligase
MMQSAIVLDGGLKSALTIVRSLGEKDIPLSVGAERDSGMALHSRYVKHAFTYPSPYTETDAFVAAIEHEAKELGDTPVVFACSDATFLALYGARERLGAVCTLIFPDARAMEIAFDKAITYSLARVSGIPTITTHMPTTTLELERVAQSVKYPAVIKPRKSVTTKDGVRYFGSARFVHTQRELVAVYTSLLETLGEAPLIQERVTGEEYGVEMIAHDGNPYTCVTHHRVRSLSPNGGASVVKETVEKGALRDMLETYARKMVYELNWEGPVMVEFKVDSDTKTPKLMEVNGRFWGSLPLSVRAGVDMPYHFYHLATERRFPKGVVVQTDGVQTRHFLGDVRNLLTVLFVKDTMRPYTYPKRLQAIKDFFTVTKGTYGDVWSLHDPKPAMMELWDIWKRRVVSKKP